MVNFGGIAGGGIVGGGGGVKVEKNILENEVKSCTNFDGIMEEMETYYQNQYVKECRKYEIHKVAKYYVDPPNYKSQLPGEANLRRFEEILNMFKYKRHVFQREFHDIITKALAESIVGEDWSMIGPKLMRKRDWRKRSKCAMALAPRRFGKSVSIAMVCVAYAMVKPGSVQSIFSTGRRASAHLLDLCKKFAIELDLNIDRSNQEELWIKHPDGTMSKIFSYPANAKINFGDSHFYFFFFFKIFINPFPLFCKLLFFFSLYSMQTPNMSLSRYSHSLSYNAKKNKARKHQKRIFKKKINFIYFSFKIKIQK